jgi:acyl-CoA synthetase (NDP forming)
MYEKIFYPETIALIGASDDPTKFGNLLLDAQIRHGFKGTIFPVNPNAAEVHGIRSWPDVESIPEPVDFAIIAVPDQMVIPAVEACARKGIKGVEVVTSGFREAGHSGKALENELIRIVKETGIRVIGPNCFGVYSPAVGLTYFPGVEFSRKTGPVGFISQSGGGGCDAAYMARGRGVHFSFMVSYGNGCDIDATELLRYFENDPKTRFVGAYIEGVRDGRAFFNALRSCSAKKPVVIFKSGLTDQGQRGTIGHTGSLAGSQSVWEGAVKSAGAVSAAGVQDLVECLMAFQCLEGFTGGNAAVMAGSGLRCVEALDAASISNIAVPELSDETRALIKSFLPPAGGRAGNPADLGSPVMPPKVMIPMMNAIASSERIHFIVLYQMLYYILYEGKRRKALKQVPERAFEFHMDVAEAGVRIRKDTGKPLVLILPNIVSHPDHSDIEKGRIIACDYYTSMGIPCFENGYQAFSVLRRVFDYYRRREENKETA